MVEQLFLEIRNQDSVCYTGRNFHSYSQIFLKVTYENKMGCFFANLNMMQKHQQYTAEC